MLLVFIGGDDPYLPPAANRPLTGYCDTIKIANSVRYLTTEALDFLKKVAPSISKERCYISNKNQEISDWSHSYCHLLCYLVFSWVLMSPKETTSILRLVG